MSEESYDYRIRRLELTVNGPPHPGLEKRVDAFITAFTAVEKERERVQGERHTENQGKLNLILVIATVLGVLLSALLIMHGWEDVKSGKLKLPADSSLASSGYRPQ